MKKTILIVGISSFVGSNLAEYLKNYFRIIGTYCSFPIYIPGILTLKCDVLDKEALQIVIHNFKPDVTIYAAGLSSIELCDENSDESNGLNALGLFNVATFTERYKSKICYISSSHIFSGINRPCGENDAPNPGTSYGKAKASAEFFLQKSCLNYLIFRCCNLYGRGVNPHRLNNFEKLERLMWQEKVIVCDKRVFAGFLDIYYLAALVKMAIDKNVMNRLFQVSSSNILNFYKFASIYSKIFGTNSELLSMGEWSLKEISRTYNVDKLEYERYFHLAVDNIENYFRIKLPSIEESLKLSFLRLGGGKAHKKFETKENIAIKFI